MVTKIDYDMTCDVCWQLITSKRGKYENVLEIVLLFTGRTIDEVINYNPIKCPFAEVNCSSSYLRLTRHVDAYIYSGRDPKLLIIMIYHVTGLLSAVNAARFDSYFL